MIIRQQALIGVCLAIYLIVWLAFLCAYLIHIYRQKRLNIHKTVLLYSVTVFVRHWGWCGALLLMWLLSFLLPSVAIVTQDLDRKIAEEKALEKRYSWYKANSTYLPHQTFYYDGYYVLGSYNGKRIFGGSYIHNTTDSVLNIYATTMGVAGPISVDDEGGGFFINPGEMQPLTVTLDSKFASPSSYVKKKEVVKQTWTLDTREHAEWEKASIRNKIQRSHDLLQNACGIPYTSPY